MQAGWLSDLSIPAIVIGILALMVAAAALGRLIRHFQEAHPSSHARETSPSVAQEGYLFGAVLATLGLLLAFTFGMVLNRYETRRELVTKEANAIGTSYLRAQFLDEPHRSRLSGLLVSYAANRAELAGASGNRERLLARNDELLTDIWTALRAARESAAAHSLTIALLQSFNEVIDLDTERKVAWDLKVPNDVLLLLIGYLTVTAALVGHQVDGPRGRRAAFVLFVLVAVSIGVITDINRPMSGRSRESQAAMLMLLQSLRAQPPEVFDRLSKADAQAVRKAAAR
jgi:hypothetical protein